MSKNNLLGGCLLLLLGIIIGWCAREISVGSTPVLQDQIIPPADSRLLEESEVSLVPVVDSQQFLRQLAREPVSVRQVELRKYLATHGDQFDVLMTLSGDLSEQGHFEEALEMLLRSSIAIESIAQQDLFKMSLARLIDRYTRELISLNQFGEVDRLYEQLTLTLPQFAQYHLELGTLRIRMGNLQSALVPLAQIANHDKLGAEARRLMLQIEGSESLVPAAFEELPLIARTGQFLVEAMIDDELPILVLIDTGAAMTILESGVLERLGYNLSGKQEYFVTANGVVQAPVVTIDSFGLGRARLNNVTVGALDMAMQGKVEGLLGMNFLRHYDFHIDQNRSILVLDQR